MLAGTKPAVVELDLGGTWTDITDDVIGKDLVKITRGLRGEASRLDPSTCNMSIRNAFKDPGRVDGTYSPRNPLSPYYGLLGRNTPIRVGVDRLQDAFGRTVVDGWGSADTGQAWTTSGTAANFDVAAGVGTIVSAISGQTATAGVYGHVEMLTKIRVNARTSGQQFGLVARRQDGSNVYRYEIVIGSPDQLQVRKLIGGSGVAWATNLAFVVGAGTWYWMRVSSCYRQRVKLWADGDPEPESWMVDIFDDNPFNYGHLPAVGAVGCHTGLGAGNIVSFDDLQVDSWRFHGEVSSWPPRWDQTGEDVWVPIEASGLLRRLSQGAKPLKSAIFREATSETNLPHLKAYWPCEDGTASTQLSSGLVGGTAMRILGDYQMASSSTIPGSEPLVTLSAAGIGPGRVPAYTNTGVIAFRGVFDVPAAGYANGTRLMELWQTGGGSLARWRLTYGTGGTLNLGAYDNEGTLLAESGVIGFAINGLRQMIGWQVEQSGSNIAYGMFTRHIDEDGNVIEGGYNNTLASLTVGQAAELYVAPDRNMADTAVGHLMIGDSVDLAAALADALVGNTGENAMTRIARLCEEEGVPYAEYTYVHPSARCGPQRAATLLELLQDAADADGGMLGEAREQLALTYRPLAALYNQDPVATFDYQAQELAPPLEPVDDDQHVRNDITVSRLNGGFARAIQTTGTLSVQPPPDGVGTYDEQVTLNVEDDDQLPDIATWRRHTGTWDEARYPTVKVDLMSLASAGKTTLAELAAAADFGDQLAITDPPVWLPPDQIDVTALGYTEEFDAYERSLTFVCGPAGLYRVFQLEETDLGRLDTAGSELAASTAAGATSLLVTTTAGPLWRTGSAAWDVMASGSRLAVTNVASGLTDAFGRVTASGWGIPSTSYPGTAYQLSGTAGDFSTTGALGRIATTTINSLYLAHVDLGSTDAEWVGQVTVPVLPTGAPISLWACARLTDASNYYLAQISIATSGTVTLSIGKRVGGTLSTLASTTLTETHSAGNTWNLGIRIIGPELAGKAWKTTDSGWQVSATDTELTTGTRIAAGARRETGNTNGAQNIDWDNLAATNPQIFTVSATRVNGVDKTLAAGTPLALYPPVAWPLAGYTTIAAYRMLSPVGLNQRGTKGQLSSLGVSSTFGTSETVVHTLPNFVFKAGRAYKVTYYGGWNDVSGAPTRVNPRLRRTSVSGTLWADWGWREVLAASTAIYGDGDVTYLRRNASSDLVATVVLTALVDAGTAQHYASATFRRVLVIEDVGAAADFATIAFDVS